MHFLKWKFSNFVKISQEFVPKGPVDEKSALVQVMAWCQAITWTNDDAVLWYTIYIVGFTGSAGRGALSSDLVYHELSLQSMRSERGMASEK